MYTRDWYKLFAVGRRHLIHILKSTRLKRFEIGDVRGPQIRSNKCACCLLEKLYTYQCATGNCPSAATRVGCAWWEILHTWVSFEILKSVLRRKKFKLVIQFTEARCIRLPWLFQGIMEVFAAHSYLKPWVRVSGWPGYCIWFEPTRLTCICGY